MRDGGTKSSDALDPTIAAHRAFSTAGPGHAQDNPIDGMIICINVARPSSKKATFQEHRFRELRGFAEQCGIEVRCEKLSRDLGYQVRSGGCLVNGKKWVIVDRRLPARDRLDVLADEIRESLSGDVEIPANLQPILQASVS